MKAIILIAALAAAGPAYAEISFQQARGPRLPNQGADKAYVFDGPAIRLPSLTENARPFAPPAKPAPEPKTQKQKMQLAQAEPAPRPLPPDSFQWDGNRKDLKSFEPPSPVVIGDGPRELPPRSFQFDGRQKELRPFGAPPKPQPEPEKKPAKSIG